MRDFDAERWEICPTKVWGDARSEAKAAIRTDVELDITASDIDPEVLSLARFHVKKAGVADCVRVEQRNVTDFAPPRPYGCIVTNPPYGERIGEKKQVDALYRSMGESLRAQKTWSVFVITSATDFERLYGKRSDKKRKLYNGRIQTNLYQYLGPLPPRK